MFPIINEMNDVIFEIKDRKEFQILDKGTYYVINYNVAFSDTFPEITNDMTEKEKHSLLIRRECRGLIFDKNTSKIISRPYHKFFNINERTETLINNIDISKSHIVLDKLDGSFIRPFMTSDGIFRIGTKRGETDVADLTKSFFEKDNYRKFSLWCFENNLTPIFEYTSPKWKIVINYENSDLTLTGIRHNITGEYINYR